MLRVKKKLRHFFNLAAIYGLIFGLLIPTLGSVLLYPKATNAQIDPGNFTPPIQQIRQNINVMHYPNQYFEIDPATDKSKSFIYLGDQKIAEINEQSEVNYYVTDHLGSDTMVIDDSGILVEQKDYQPYGKINQEESTIDNDYGYTGKELDNETELNYFQQRYYDSELGKFVSVDPLLLNLQNTEKYNKKLQQLLTNPQELNSYLYVNGNPLKYTDPNGESSQSIYIKTFVKGFSKIAGPLAVFGYAYDLLKPSPAGGDIDRSESYQSELIVSANSEKSDYNIPMTALAGTSQQSGIQIGSKIKGFGQVILNTPGEMTGFVREGVVNPYHGLDQAITRGVTPKELLDTVKNPLITIQQGNGNIYRLTENAAVVLNKAGKVVTTYGKADFFPKVIQLLTKIIK